tara:strand:- start:8607 stop:9017 length:411 start_codon:yes stop_codon:yes gene_type:complete
MVFKFENGLEIQKSRIGEELRRTGFYVDHQVRAGQQSISTSVGFHKIGLPEIVILGHNLDKAHQYCASLYLACQIGLAKLSANNRIQEVFDDEVSFSEIPDDVKKSHFLASRLYYGSWDFSALKMDIGSRDSQRTT